MEPRVVLEGRTERVVSIAAIWEQQEKAADSSWRRKPRKSLHRVELAIHNLCNTYFLYSVLWCTYMD